MKIFVFLSISLCPHICLLLNIHHSEVLACQKSWSILMIKSALSVFISFSFIIPAWDGLLKYKSWLWATRQGDRVHIHIYLSDFVSVGFSSLFSYFLVKGLWRSTAKSPLELRSKILVLRTFIYGKYGVSPWGLGSLLLPCQ